MTQVDCSGPAAKVKDQKIGWLDGELATCGRSAGVGS